MNNSPLFVLVFALILLHFLARMETIIGVALLLLYFTLKPLTVSISIISAKKTLKRPHSYFTYNRFFGTTHACVWVCGLFAGMISIKKSQNLPQYSIPFSILHLTQFFIWALAAGSPFIITPQGVRSPLRRWILLWSRSFFQVLNKRKFFGATLTEHFPVSCSVSR